MARRRNSKPVNQTCAPRRNLVFSLIMHAVLLQPERGPRRKLKSAARRAARHLPSHLPPVLVFTDPERSPPPDTLANWIPAGWGLVYRHFGAADAGKTAAMLARLSKHRRFTLLVGADPELACQVGASGVHWPQRLIHLAHRSAPRFALNTLSAHTPSDVLGPQPRWADARVLSTVFPSNSRSAGPAIGATRFRLAANDARLPVYGLGGINTENATQIASSAGLAGVSFCNFSD